ncbi:hypothetical protein OH77DRAFT_1423824 [Trametes cingulata]|nr:hypothetical protein OH77DRAFT_1423824 [Trametes cingulata]
MSQYLQQFPRSTIAQIPTSSINLELQTQGLPSLAPALDVSDEVGRRFPPRA